MKPSIPRFRPVLSALLRLRPFLAILLTVASLSYLTPLAATAMIGQETLRLHAQRALISATGRNVVLEGPVRLTMFPWLGLKGGPVVLANSPGFGPQPLARIQSVTIGLNLWALARKKILVESIALREPSLQLVRDEQGRGNWLPPAAPFPGDEAPSGWKVESLPYGLQMANASLAYTDVLTGVDFTVRHLNLLTGPGKTFPFSFSCELTAKPLDVVAEIHAKGQASYGDTGEHLFVHGAEVTGALSRAPSQDAPLPELLAHFSAMMLFHGQGGALEVSNLLLEGLGARVTGQINIAGLYEEAPTLQGSLAASAQRNGPWMRLFGLSLPTALPDAPVLSAPASTDARTPVLQPLDIPQRIEAELEFGAAPQGWKLDAFTLHDGAGKLTAEASWFDQDLRFDITANDLNLDPWIPQGGGKLTILPVWPRPGWSVHGKASARDVRLAGQDVGELLLSAQGEHGALRLYPFTLRSSECLIALDLRLEPTPAGASFNGLASISPLPPDGPGQALASASAPLLQAAEARLTGEITTTGAAGMLQLRVDDLPPNWQPPQLPQTWVKALRTLGGLSAKGTLRAYAPNGLPDEAWSSWEATGLEFKTRYALVSGKMNGQKGKALVDLSADRLDLDRLSVLAGLFQEGPSGFSPWPLEGRIAVRRFSGWGHEFEDVVLAGQASPLAVHLSTVSALYSGGKISGGFDMEDKAGRRIANLSLTGSGVQASQLSSLLPAGPRLTGPLDGRLSLEASEILGNPLWRNVRAQADLQMGSGLLDFGPAPTKPGSGTVWPVSKAVLNLKLASHAPAQANENTREAALVDVTGNLRLETPGMVRLSQFDLRGQAGLDQVGHPLWYRQPQAEGSFSVVLPYAQPLRLATCQWKGRFEADLDRGGFSLADGEVYAAGIPVRLRLSGTPGQAGHPSQPTMSLSGMLTIPEFNPRDAASRLGLTIPSVANAKNLVRARLSTEIAGSFKDLHLNHILLELDDAQLTGQAIVANGKPRLDLALAVLDLDALFPSVDIPNPTHRPEQPIPMELLRDLNIDAKLQAGKLIKGKLVWGNTLLEASCSGGRFNYRQQASNFYGGLFTLDVKGDARGQDLKAQAAMRISGASGVELLKDLSGGSALTKGALDFELSVQGTGKSDKALVRSLVGTARFDLNNGAMVFRDTGAKTAHPAPSSASRPFIGERDIPQPPPTPVADATADGMPFGRMGAVFAIRQGVGTTSDFIFTGPALSAKGGGQVSLVDETILLNLMANVKDVGDLPVRISGPLYDPKLDIDKSGILADTIVNIVKGVVNIPANLLNQLRRLF